MHYNHRGENRSIFFLKLKHSRNKKFLNAFAALLVGMFVLIPFTRAHATTAGAITLPWNYTFSTNGTLNEVGSPDQSSSPYWWLSSGGQLTVNSGLGQSLQGVIGTDNKWNGIYSKSNPIATDNGSHPQNLFSLFLRAPVLNSDQSISVKINADNLNNTANRNPWNGILLVSRWQNNNNYYYAGIRDDGHAIVKKKVNGIYYTIAEKSLISGTWNSTSNPSLLPKNTWLRLRSVTNTDSNGVVHIQLYTDMTQSGNWKLVLDAADNGSNGARINTTGLSGIRSDFMDLGFDNYKIVDPSITILPTTTTTTTTVPTPTSTPTTNILFSDLFSQYTDGLITNEYTYWNKTDPTSKQSSLWEMDSGSLFASGGTGWTGIPNDISPNALSTNGNNSSIFRLVTKQSNFGDVSVNFDFLNQGLNSSGSTPAVSWDGLHIFLRYQSEYNLYYASVNRRDNTVVIKKKIPGGPSNNGTYYELSKYTAHTVPYGTWQNVTATVKNNADGSVTIELYANGVLLTKAVDDGSIGGAPIRAAGKVGMRGDNANLKIKNFKVSAL